MKKQPKGKKYDTGKLRYDLLPVTCIREVVEVLTAGAKKYGDENWRLVENPTRRYYAACMRHLEAWRAGEKVDTETNRSHLAHAVCCLLFLMTGDEPKKTTR